MILRQELLDAAVSLWMNIIPKEIMITNMMPVPGIEPGLRTMSLRDEPNLTTARMPSPL